MSFYVQDHPSQHKIDSPCQFQQFSGRGKGPVPFTPGQGVILITFTFDDELGANLRFQML